MPNNDNSIVIQANGLHKSFGDTVAVNDLSFSVAAGKIIGILGPNGAGKTTTINMLTTLIPIDRGSATVSGFDVATAAHAVRQVIGLAGQSAAVDEKLTARENLRLFGRFYKIPRSELQDRVETLITGFDMTDYADRPAETYSGGQRRRLDVVAALVASPPALFLDEPTTGLDPRSRSDIWDAIEARHAEAAIVLTTQYLEEADRLADEILLIDQGTVVAAARQRISSGTWTMMCLTSIFGRRQSSSEPWTYSSRRRSRPKIVTCLIQIPSQAPQAVRLTSCAHSTTPVSTC